jgi:membrane protein
MSESDVVAAGEPEASWQERARAFLGALFGALREVNLTGLAAQVSYSLIFAMPSILLVVALVARDVDERTGFAISQEVRDLVADAIPAEVQPLVVNLINDAVARARQGPTTLSAIMAILIAAFAAGNGLADLARAFDRAAGIVDKRSAWQQRFVFTASAVLIAMVLILAFTLYIWGGDLIALVVTRLGVAENAVTGWRNLQAPVMLLLVFLGTTLLYMTSSARYSFRDTAPGAAVATVLWLLLVNGFQLYIRFAQPGSAYGAASSVLIFLVFLYLSSMALIIGAMTAAVLVRRANAAAIAAAGGARARPARVIVSRLPPRDD